MDRHPPGFIAALTAAAAATSAQAQVITWNAGSGLWNTPANWSPVNVPDSPGEDAVIGLPVTVTLDSSPQIGALHLTDPLATLALSAGRTLRLSAPASTNNGLIEINPENSASDAILRFDADVSLGGAGEVRLASGGDNAQVITNSNAVLTNGPSHTIRGVGRIAGRIVNNGAIRADASIARGGITLLLEGQEIINNGLISAEAVGSTALLGSVVIDQTGGGELRATDEGTIAFAGGAVIGGQVNSLTPVAVWEARVGTTLFTGVTTSGEGRVAPGATLAIDGPGLVNNGTITVNPLNSGASAFMRFEADGALSGSGEVVLAGVGDRSQLHGASGVTITHGRGPQRHRRGTYPCARVVCQPWANRPRPVGGRGRRLWQFHQRRVGRAGVRDRRDRHDRVRPLHRLGRLRARRHARPVADQRLRPGPSAPRAHHRATRSRGGSRP